MRRTENPSRPLATEAPEALGGRTSCHTRNGHPLNGFPLGNFPMEGLAPELHLRGIPATFSGHIQPGCTLLTVDCLLPLGDASQIRTDGIHVLAESILAGPLVGLGKLNKVRWGRFQINKMLNGGFPAAYTPGPTDPPRAPHAR